MKKIIVYTSFFFFQAEDGIRDYKVTGVQTCALPISGLKNALMCLNQARYGIAWGGIGSAMETYYTALEYAKERVQFSGQPIASHQLVQEKLAWMITEISKGQLLSIQLGRLKDAGRLKHW